MSVCMRVRVCVHVQVLSLPPELRTVSLDGSQAPGIGPGGSGPRSWFLRDPHGGLMAEEGALFALPWGPGWPSGRSGDPGQSWRGHRPGPQGGKPDPPALDPRQQPAAWCGMALAGGQARPGFCLLG